MSAARVVSAADAWAVGSIADDIPLVWHWNGTVWKNVRLPAAVVRVLIGNGSVAATSKTNVWMARGPLVHWNGRQWKVVSPNIVSPNIGRRYVLSHVAATSARNVWAIGNTEFKPRWLMLHWNGRRWACAIIPQMRFVQLFAVSTSSADNAWVVGRSADAALTLHWNGHTWKQVIAPHPGQSDILTGVGIIPRSDRAWAVGDTDINQGITLILHWNGTAWH